MSQRPQTTPEEASAARRVHRRLAFGFESLVKRTELDPLEIQIETTRRRNLCTVCEHEFDVVDHNTVCPRCGERRTRLIGGDEIVIIYFEFEE